MESAAVEMIKLTTNYSQSANLEIYLLHSVCAYKANNHKIFNGKQYLMSLHATAPLMKRLVLATLLAELYEDAEQAFSFLSALIVTFN